MSILWSQPNLFRALPSPEFNFGGDTAGSQPSAGLASALFHMTEREISLETDGRHPLTTMSTTSSILSPEIASPGSVMVVSASATWNILELYGDSPEPSPQDTGELASPSEPSFPEKALINRKDGRRRPLPPPPPPPIPSLHPSDDIAPPPPAHLKTNSLTESVRHAENRTTELVRTPRLQSRARPLQGHTKSKSLSNSDTPQPPKVPISTPRSRMPPPPPLPLDFPLPPLPSDQVKLPAAKDLPPAPPRSRLAPDATIPSHPVRPSRNGVVSPFPLSPSAGSRHKPSASESSLAMLSSMNFPTPPSHIPPRPERKDGPSLLAPPPQDGIPDPSHPTRPSRKGVVSPLPSEIIQRLDALESLPGLPGKGVMISPPPTSKHKPSASESTVRTGMGSESDVLLSYFGMPPKKKSELESSSLPHFKSGVPLPDASTLALRAIKKLAPGEVAVDGTSTKGPGIPLPRDLHKPSSSTSRQSDPSHNVSSSSSSFPTTRPLVVAHKKGVSLDSINGKKPAQTVGIKGSGPGHQKSSSSSSTFAQRDPQRPDATLAKRQAMSRVGNTSTGTSTSANVNSPERRPGPAEAGPSRLRDMFLNQI
ncbi:hypothetical protein BT96DRAFT_1025906 [Gymnopus androsaceus JB14]|uniref:Uncharacterized protein n=1 Tax=Gymnopus androsaceus JB14 TaxID=1447944 RepID=A0A6A4GQ15_9AGAR|nr:hypothetical protein BT96DRAFT_1025906 [Gymnopus androsaceus JB14]